MQKTELVLPKPIKVPGPDHAIAIEANPARVVALSPVMWSPTACTR